MKFEKQVVSLEPSIKLEKLGVKQESLFSYLITKSGFEKIEETHHDRKQFEDVYGRVIEQYSAFTVAELGLKAKGITYGIRENGVCWARIDMSFYTDRKWSENDNSKEIFEAETEADCRAKMLIYLLENNLLKLDK